MRKDRKKFYERHLEYLRHNHNILPLNRLVGGLANLKLVLSHKAVKSKLKEMGLNWIDPVKEEEEKKQTTPTYAKSRIKRLEDERVEIMLEITKAHYPSGGAKAVKNHLNSANIHKTSSQINYFAKKNGIMRDKKQPPPTPKKSIPLNPLLQRTYYTIEDFNERNGTNFSIYPVEENKAEVIDVYLDQTRIEIMLELVKEVFKEGARMQRGKGMGFYVWGD